MEWSRCAPPTRRARRLRRAAAAGLGAGLALAAAGAAQADRLVTKGVALEGTVKSISASEVVLETVYGEGELTIAIEDVESLETETVFHIVHGADVDTVGPVTGLTDDALRVAEPSGDVEVPLDRIRTVLRDPGDDASPLERLEVELPYWSIEYSLSFAATQATDDTLSFSTGLDLERERGPHRTIFSSHYRLGTQREQGEEEDTTANELYGKLRQEYAFTDRWFTFGSIDAEYDEVESLSLRTVPRVGLGYELLRVEDAWLSVDGGLAYVYERFFDGEVNEYPGVGLGAESEWELPFGDAVWRNRVDYTPSLQDFEDYLLRGQTSLLMPLLGRLSFTASLIDTYDSTPAEGNDRNSLSTLMGLTFGF